MLNAVYALLVDMPNGMIDRSEVMDGVDKLLATPVGNMPNQPSREEWGTSKEAQEGQKSLMAFAGGPAPVKSEGP